MKEQKIVKLSERDHILKRPSMYAGSVKKESSLEYILKDNKFVKEELLRTPALLKIVNEIIDNSIDEHIKTEGKFSNKIDITMEKDFFRVKDNGRGIPVEESVLPDGSKILVPELCWTHARAGSNFEDNSNSIGTNGVGSAITAIFSKSFVGETKDGKKHCILKTKDNNDSIVCEIVKATKERGTTVTSYPDFERFEEKEFTESYFNIIKTRLYFLNVCYPKITFTFNGEKIKIDPKSFIGMFSEKTSTVINNGKYTLAITMSETDELQQFTLMNGLYLKNGGSCVDFITGEISNRIKDKLAKRYPALKPADIKNKMFVISILNNFIDAKYDSQTKEKLTNSMKEVKEYFELDLDDLANKVSKNKELIDSITDYFRIKEEFKKRQELKSLEKPQKKIKCDRYTPSIGEEDMLILCEGYSAVSGLQACLGRKGIAYFELKGKPKNVSGSTSITENEELSDLYKIIKNSSFKRIVVGSDNDLDGIHICALLINFLVRWIPETMDKLYRLNTPIAASLSNKKMQDWCYHIDEISNLSGKEIKYFKGLGSWTKELLSQVIKKDTLGKMLMELDYTELVDMPHIKDWFDKDRDDIRKEKVRNSDFNIIKI